MNDWNKQIIEEFRANGGKVTGPFAEVPVLLLHTTGRKSGKTRVNPLAYQDLGDGAVAVFGSKGGYPSHPDWYHNLIADPNVTVEVGAEAYEATARVASGGEREEIWTRQKSEFPGFAGYEQATTREIPVVVLERRTG
jgi:deazaflavin-dependent oxidoreductase (nitroreductase family)